MMAVTLPSFSARMLFSIFIDSSVSSTSPFLTSAPTATATFTTDPGSGDTTLYPPAGAAGAGAAGCGCGAGCGLGAGAAGCAAAATANCRPASRSDRVLRVSILQRHRLRPRCCFPFSSIPWSAARRLFSRFVRLRRVRARWSRAVAMQ